MELLDLLAKASGLSTTSLIAIFFVITLGFLLALREFMFWYLRLHRINDSFKELSQEVKELRAELVEFKNMSATKPVKVSLNEDKIIKVNEEKKDRFNLSH